MYSSWIETCKYCSWKLIIWAKLHLIHIHWIKGENIITTHQVIQPQYGKHAHQFPKPLLSLPLNLQSVIYFCCSVQLYWKSLLEDYVRWNKFSHYQERNMKIWKFLKMLQNYKIYTNYGSIITRVKIFSIKPSLLSLSVKSHPPRSAKPINHIPHFEILVYFSYLMLNVFLMFYQLKNWLSQFFKETVLLAHDPKE